MDTYTHLSSWPQHFSGNDQTIKASNQLCNTYDICFKTGMNLGYEWVSKKNTQHNMVDF